MIIRVYKDGRSMECSDNPEGLKILAKEGWSVQPPKKPKKVKNDDSE